MEPDGTNPGKNAHVNPAALSQLVGGIEAEAEETGPLVTGVGEDLDHDPPRSFQTEAAARKYFDGRDADPTIVIFAPGAREPDHA